MKYRDISRDTENSLFRSAKDTVIIVRDERSGKRLAKLYSAQILLNNIKIVTAEAIAECLYLPPLNRGNDSSSHLKMIAEDKRVLSFYQTVSGNSEWTESLNITGYFNAVHTANQFYALWNDINENMITHSDVLNVIDKNRQQCDMWNMYCDIYNTLGIFLRDHGLTDRIFVRNRAAVDANLNNISVLAGTYKNAVFLDCLGDTPLAGYMFGRVYAYLSDKLGSASVRRVMTLPEELADKDKWTLRYDRVSLNNAADSLKGKAFSFVQASSPSEVYYKAVSLIASRDSDDKTTSVIDLDTGHSAFSYMLAYQKFGIKPQMPYFSCRLYVWLDTMYKLLDSIAVNKSTGTGMCDINIYRDAIYTESFIGFYFGDRDEDRRLLSDYRRFIDSLISKGYIYYDTDNSILKCESKHYAGDKINRPAEAEKYDKIAQKLESLNGHIRSIIGIGSVSEFKDFIYSSIIADDGRSRFFYDEHFKVFEMLFTAVEDTESLERMGIITDWGRLFSRREGVPQVGISLLRILIDYLKDQKIPVSDSADADNRLIWTLADKYDKTLADRLILLNMNDKVFPSVSFADKFFSEKQRQKLGMQTSDDAVSRQRLMLADMLKQSDDITVIYIENESKDMFGSGFIDEIRFCCESSGIRCTDIDITFSDNHKSLMQNVLGIAEPQSVNDKQDSLVFSFDRDKDNVYNLSASKLKSLLQPVMQEDKTQPRKTKNVLAVQAGKNQYTAYYIENIIGVKFFEQQRIPLADSRIAGNIIHDLYRDIITDTVEHGGSRDKQYSLDEELFSRGNIRQTADRIISHLYDQHRNSYLYQVPDDGWTKQYLKEHILDYAADMLNKLFDKLREDQRGHTVQIIPETEYGEDPESNISVSIKGHEIRESLSIRQYIEDNNKPDISIPQDAVFCLDARADLRIKGCGISEIIDYKTGNKNSNNNVQLLAYKLVYDREQTDNTDAFFFNIFEPDKDMFQSEKSDRRFPCELYDYIYKAIDPVFRLGYFAPNEKYLNRKNTNTVSGKTGG